MDSNCCGTLARFEIATRFNTHHIVGCTTHTTTTTTTTTTNNNMYTTDDSNGGGLNVISLSVSGQLDCRQWQPNEKRMNTTWHISEQHLPSRPQHPYWLRAGVRLLLSPDQTLLCELFMYHVWSILLSCIFIFCLLSKVQTTFEKK
jgi:hypothetical protein